MDLKQQFVTYEIALKLKELRFDEECLAKYLKDGRLVYHSECLNGVTSQNSKILGEAYAAPLWQQVIDLFREKHDITIDVAKIYNGTDNYHFALNLKWEYFEGTYYEARKAAILKAIELCQKE